MFWLWSPPIGLLLTLIYIIGVTVAQAVTCDTGMVSSVTEWTTYSFTVTTTNWPYVSNHPECRSYMLSLEGYRYPPSTDSFLNSAAIGNPSTFLTETSNPSPPLETGATAASDFTSRTPRKTCPKGGKTSTGAQTMSLASATETIPLYISSWPPSQPSSSTTIPTDVTVTVNVLTLTETETVFESLPTYSGSMSSYSSTSHPKTPGSGTTIPTAALSSTTYSRAKMCTRRVTKTFTAFLGRTTSST